MWKCIHSHQNDQRSPHLCQRFPVHASGSMGITPMPCHDSDRGCMIAMRNGNAGICGNCNGRTHTGYNFKWNAGLGKSQSLFTATAKDKRVAPLQANDEVSLLCVVNEESVNLFLF